MKKILLTESYFLTTGANQSYPDYDIPLFSVNFKACSYGKISKLFT